MGFVPCTNQYCITRHGVAKDTVLHLDERQAQSMNLRDRYYLLDSKRHRSCDCTVGRLLGGLPSGHGYSCRHSHARSPMFGRQYVGVRVVDEMDERWVWCATSRTVVCRSGLAARATPWRPRRCPTGCAARRRHAAQGRAQGLITVSTVWDVRLFSTMSLCDEAPAPRARSGII